VSPKAKIKFNTLDEQELFLDFVTLAVANFNPENNGASMFKALLIQVCNKVTPIVALSKYSNRKVITIHFNHVEATGVLHLMELYLDVKKDSSRPYADSFAREWYQVLDRQIHSLFNN